MATSVKMMSRTYVSIHGRKFSPFVDQIKYIQRNYQHIYND